MSDRRSLAIGIGLILIIWLSRLITLQHFPPFLDEALHVFFGERSFQTSPLAYGSQGRLFTIWWYMLFQPHLAATFPVVRIATVLAVLVGAAGIIGTGRLKGGQWGAVIAGLIYLFSTYHQFYDMLALSDTVSAAAVAFSLYTAYRLTRRINYFDALLTGIGLFIAVGAKVSALVFFIIPLAAAFTLHPTDRSWRAQMQWLAVALVTGLGLTAVYGIGLSIFGYDLFALVTAHNPNMTDNISTRFLSNASHSLNIIIGYTGIPAFAVMIISLLILVIRREFYLPLCLLVSAAALWSGQRQSTRFFDASVIVLLTCTAIGLIHITSALKHIGKGIQSKTEEVHNRALFGIRPYIGHIVVLAVILGWGLFQWFPFTSRMINDPAHLNLPVNDYEEYIVSDASGFGLGETKAFLQQFAVQEVIGLLSNCQGLRYLSLSNFPVNCPRVNPNGEDIPVLAQLLEDKRGEQSVYVVVEDSAYVPQDVPGKLLTVIEHPAGRPTLSIYQLYPPGA